MTESTQSVEQTVSSNPIPTESNQTVASDILKPAAGTRRYAGMRYSLDGNETLYQVMGEDGQIQNESVPEAPEHFDTLPKKWRLEHTTAFTVLVSFVDAVQKQVGKDGKPARVIPAMRDELKQFGVETSTLKELEHMGFVKVITTPFVSSRGRRTGGHAIVVFTAKGRTLRQQVQAQLKQTQGAKDDSIETNPQENQQTQEEVSPPSLGTDGQGDSSPVTT